MTQIVYLPSLFFFSPSFLERSAALDIDEEEGESVLEENLDHVKKWVNELTSWQFLKPYSQLRNIPETAGDFGVCGTTSLQVVEQSLTGSSGEHSAPKPTIAHDEVFPSTSGDGDF